MVREILLIIRLLPTVRQTPNTSENPDYILSVSDLFFKSTTEAVLVELVPLDRLFIQVLFLSWDVVGSHDTGLHTSGNSSREDTAKSVESTLVAGGYHFGDVHHKDSLGVTVFHSYNKFLFHIKK